MPPLEEEFLVFKTSLYSISLFIWVAALVTAFFIFLVLVNFNASLKLSLVLWLSFPLELPFEFSKLSSIKILQKSRYFILTNIL